jgi:hypothetical protein
MDVRSGALTLRCNCYILHLRVLPAKLDIHHIIASRHKPQTMTRHLITTAILTTASAFTPALHPSRTSPSSSSSSTLGSTLNAAGNLHGQEACFLPLLQNDDEYIAPRIVQVRDFIWCSL